MSSPAAASSQLKLGDVIRERYVVERLLGRGGMGEVYEAFDKKLERRVALKIVVAAGSSDARRRLEAEAKAVAALEHPGIVTLHDVLEHDDLLVLVMELVRGVSLRSSIEVGPLLPLTVAKLITGIAEALQAAHQRGFVHRDVKPDNVIVRPDGRTVLLDFGIAKASTPSGTSPFSASVTIDGALVGTPAYLSPEQVRGDPSSPATDQFALAVTAYELLTGELPWIATSLHALIVAIASEPPRPLHHPPKTDDQPIDGVFARALAKAPEDRYESVSAFAAALDEVLRRDHHTIDLTIRTGGAKPADRPAPKDVRTLTAPPLGSADETRDAETQAPGEKRASDTKVEASARPFYRRPLFWLASVTLIGAALAGSRMIHRSPTISEGIAQPSAAPAAADSESLLIEAMPPSGAQTDEDRAKFRDAARALRLADLSDAIRKLDDLIVRSPSFSGAQLLRAYCSFLRAADLDEHGRAAFRAASAERDRLSERDARFLDALAPSFLDPPRWRETAEMLEIFTRERPRDVQGWSALGFARTKLGDYAAAEKSFKKESELDPRSAFAYDLQAQFAIARNDTDSAKRLLDSCVAQEPKAMRCRSDITLLLSNSGNCEEADRQGRDALAIDPDSPLGLAARAQSTAAMGATNEVVSGFLARRRKSIPHELLAAQTIEDAYLLAKRAGDFAGALAALSPSTLADPSLSSADSGRFTLARVATLWETGETAEAGKTAASYLALGATRPLPERAGLDVTGRLLGYLLDAGLISAKEFTSRRDAWISAWRARRTDEEWKSEVGPDVWTTGYGFVGSEDAERAKQAFEAAARLGIDIVPQGGTNVDPTAPDPNGLVGALLMAAGRLDEAQKLLERANHTCRIAPDQRARLALGDLLALRHEEKGACEVYAEIEKSWGKAKPRSVTADSAREAAKRWHCAAP